MRQRQRTTPHTGFRKPTITAVLLALILLGAAGLRVNGLGWGLPALYDPDEPLFVVSALNLLGSNTLNPGWFGHPGTTTIYALALVDLVVFASGYATNQFADTAGFAQAIYRDPSIVFVAGRVFVIACGLGCIALTFVIGKRLFDRATGVVAALILAVDPLHIEFSRIIRTDMHVTVFILLGLLATCNIAERGRTRDYVLAAVWLGFGCATKWPALTIIASVFAAGVAWTVANPNERLAQWRNLALFAVVSVAALFAGTPFLFIDHATAFANLHAEARTTHLGATGEGFLANALWYVVDPLRDSVGDAGLILGAAGLAIATRRSRTFRVTVVPFAAVFFAALCAQALIWSRWVVPLLPVLSIVIAVAVVAVVRICSRAAGRRTGLVAGIAASLAVVVPSLSSYHAIAAERSNDTRMRASHWARRNIAPGSRVLVEHFALDLMNEDWRFRMPVGDAGCIDPIAELQSKIPYSRIEKWRGERAIIDLGTINPATLRSCDADFAILVDYDRYLAEAPRYPREIAIYDYVIAQGRTVAVFRPVAGRSGGPIVRIIDMTGQSPRYGKAQTSADARIR